MARTTLTMDQARPALDHAWRRIGIRPMGHQEAFALTMLTRPIVRGVAGYGSGLVVAAGAAALAWRSLHDDDQDSVTLLAGTYSAVAAHAMTMGPVRTVHSALEYDAARGTWGRHAARPLEAGMVVVVDTCMLDEATLMALVKACPASNLTMISTPESEHVLPAFGSLFRTCAGIREEMAYA